MEAWERERQRHEDEVEARRVRAQKKWKKRDKASAARKARLERSRRRRLHDHPKRRKGEVTGPAACPSCGSGERLYSIEHLTGYARGSARIEAGVAQFEYEGPTEVDWASASSAGFACDCGWRGGLADLVLA